MQTVQNRTRIRIVQSRQNSRVKELRSTLAQGIVNDNGSIAFEGLHLAMEALRSGLRISTIFVREGSEDLLEGLSLDPATDLLALPAEVFSSAVTTESPQGLACLAAAPVFTLETLFDPAATQPALIVVAAGLQDPGNLGTIIRSAEAFGATGVLALPGTVSVWNAKTLRASAGTAFRLPVVAVSEGEALGTLNERGIRILATDAHRGASIFATDLCQPAAFLIGNEGSGLAASLLAKANGIITIPCPRAVESLNAAVAASILLCEAARQRSDAAYQNGDRAGCQPALPAERL